MSIRLASILVRQIQPALRMLAHAIDACPDELWDTSDGEPPVWQHVLHATYYFQKWIRTPEMPFEPPAWVDRNAVDFNAPATPAIDHTVLRAYLAVVGSQAARMLEKCTDKSLTTLFEVDGKPFTLADLSIGQIRHVMYHVGCVSEILRRHTGQPLPWLGYDNGIDQRI